MSSSRPDSFTRFPRLPTELRLLIWSFYFFSPRIHVLHSADDANPDLDRILLTCTTLDAQTNIPVSPRIYTGICQEAREVALRSLKSRERLRTLTEPVEYTSLFGSRMFRAPSGGGQQPEQLTVDVDWERDLIYICSPTSFHPFMSLAQRDWAPKVRRMAVAVPWETRPLPGQVPGGAIRSMLFNGASLYDAVQKLERVSDIFVVLLPPLEVEVADPSDATSAASFPGEARVAKHADRSTFGFINFVDYIRDVEKGAIGAASVDMTRISLALGTHFERLGLHSSVTVTRMVDVDFCRLQDGGYQRNRRGIP